MELIFWGAGIAVLVAGAFFYRRRRLRWEATDAEVPAIMPSDELLPRASFKATRAISIEAPPAPVWPWIVQIVFGRAGSCPYDLLDNLGRPSADRILPEWQTLEIGAVAAPMANPPTEKNSFRVAGFETGRWLLWAKPNSTWAGKLTPTESGGTSLVVRLKATDRLPSALFSAPLLEIADFSMMRCQLLGIRARAEKAARGLAP